MPANTPHAAHRNPRAARACGYLAWLALMPVGAACQQPSDARPGPSLALSAPLPEHFARDTTLRLGDPTIQKQLELTGQAAGLPFHAQWQNVTGGPYTLEAFRAGVLDGGSVGDMPPVHAAFTGLDVKIIAVQLRDKPAFRLVAPPGVRPQALDDLRGKRIAYAPGQAQGAVILRALRKAGIRSGEVKLVELSSYEFKDALIGKQVDIAPLSGPSLPRYLSDPRAKGASSILPGVRDNMSFFYVRTSVLQDPDKAAALRAYAALRAKSQLWAADHPQAWIDAYYVKDQGLSREEGRFVADLAGRPQYPRDWGEAIALTQETIDRFAAETGKPGFDARRLFDLRFEHIAADVADGVDLARASNP